MKDVKLQVSVRVPNGVKLTDLYAYIRDALNGWSGEYHPSHPLRDIADVRVKTLKDKS